MSLALKLTALTLVPGRFNTAIGLDRALAVVPSPTKTATVTSDRGDCVQAHTQVLSAEQSVWLGPGLKYTLSVSP